MIFVYIINIYTFLSTIGQTYILKHDTVPELHSFGDGGTIYAVFSLPQQLILARWSSLLDVEIIGCSLILVH
jgi:hypothetical protein